MQKILKLVLTDAVFEESTKTEENFEKESKPRLD